MRVVIYARYSSDLQNDASIEDQVRLCEEMAAACNWSLIKVYSDRASSGSNRFRPAYQEMIADARRGTFDVVVAEALDRLSRDQEDVAALFKELRFAGVALNTLAEGEITELHIGLKGTMNALFLKDLAAKTHRGLRGCIEEKRSAGGKCFGYRVKREMRDNGEPLRGGREIEAAEADVIRRIFREFVRGASPRAIARRLNTEGVPGPGGRPWQDTTIRGHATRHTGILRNELYAGRLVWNRQRFIRDPQTGKRIARLNPPEAWVVEEVPELRIIDDALWNKARERLAEIAASPVATAVRESAFWTKRRPKHILTGLVVCGSCGHSMAAVGKDYLRCARAHRNNLCNSKASIRRRVLEAMVIEALKHSLMQPELVKEFVGAVNEELNRSRDQESAERAQLAARLKKVEHQLDGLITAISEGMRSPTLQARLEALESERADIERRISGPAPSPVRLHPNLADAYRIQVTTLHEALQDEGTHDEAFQLVRGLIEKVIIHDRPGGGCEIELVGEIASMVHIAFSDNKKAALGRTALNDRVIRSVVVDAGAGFEPATFRL